MTRPKKKPEDKFITRSISFDPKQSDELLEYCQKNERDLSWVIRKALDEWLKAHKDDKI